MASTPLPYNNVSSKEEMKETPYSPPILWPPGARRTPSFSSSSRSNSWDSSFELSSFSFNEESPPYSPSTPLKFKGIPFSWEQIPGIPKHQGLKKESSAHLLPLPPAGNSNSSTKKLQNQEEISPKKYHTSRFQRDPFLAALVECSKDDHDHDHHITTVWKGSSKISRSLSDRFGFINMYTSCKRTCSVSESIVSLPSRPSSPHYLLHRRSS
ncbi:hypothetical protein Salat_0525700 [Sesamum alatum]|uniref:Uncharacterized protein n=1 Tax=Sesamum alatum TaxID=300844 RepID=A0AAE1YNR2_9LAMI|nr:hypothetical protein Salat_0525700 [Sesamum alatum]